MSNFLNKNLVINFFIILVIFGLDRITKLYVISESEKNLSSELFVSKYLNVNLIWNEGIAFGLLAFSSSNIYNFVTIIIFVVILMVIYFIIKSEKMDKIFFLMIFLEQLETFMIESFIKRARFYRFAYK